MGNITFNTLSKYFTNLANTGYRKNSDVMRVLLLSHINKLLNNDFRGFITEEDYKKIERALYCLYGSSCLIPYPDYYNTKNQRVMYNGSMSELAYRVIKAEEKVEEIKEDNITIHQDINALDGRVTTLDGELKNTKDRVTLNESNIEKNNLAIEEIKNKNIVVPGEDIDEVEDFNI